MVHHAVAAVRGHTHPAVGLREQLETLAARLDESYFDASESGGAESLRLFSSARAVAAVSYALSEDDSILHEAIYEATVAMEDPSELVIAIERTLREG